MKYILLLILLAGCSVDGSKIDWDLIKDVIKECKECQEDPDCPEPIPCPECPECPEVPEPTPTPEPTEPPVEPGVCNLPMPDNCDNPPKATQEDYSTGLKLMASNSPAFKGEYRTLLPIRFTGKPYKNATNSHGTPIKQSKFDCYPDKVKTYKKNGNLLATQDYQTCVNWSPDEQGRKVCRPQFRIGSVKYDDIKNKIYMIEIIKDNEKTCLRIK